MPFFRPGRPGPDKGGQHRGGEELRPHAQVRPAPDDAGGVQRVPVPEALRHLPGAAPAAAGERGLEFDGIHPDGWF